MKRGQPDTTFPASGNAIMWLEEDDPGYGQDDELLAALGYRFTSSDMANVALKMQQFEEATVSSQGDGLTHLSSDTVQYNPSDLSTWLQSMLSELGTPFDYDGSSPVSPLHNTAAFNDPFLPSSSISMNFNSSFEDSSSSDQFYLEAITDGSVSGEFGCL